MDLNNRHPLNAIDGYENLSMLEALIPFVEYPLKLPLALFIKFSEIRLIIHTFQSIETLTRIGLNQATGDPLDMICSLTGISPEMLKMIFSMMQNNGDPMSSDIFRNFTGSSGADFSNLTGMFQSMQNGFGNTPPPAEPFNHTSTNHAEHSSPHSSDDFDKNIQSILAEYDLQQAAQYDTDSTGNLDTNNYPDI